MSDDDDFDDDGPVFQDEGLIQYIKIQANKSSPKWRDIKRKLEDQLDRLLFPADRLHYLLAVANAAHNNGRILKTLDAPLIALLPQLDDKDDRVKAALCLNDTTSKTAHRYLALNVIQGHHEQCAFPETRLDALAALLNDMRPSVLSDSERFAQHQAYFAQWQDLFATIDPPDKAEKAHDVLEPLNCYNQFKEPLIGLIHKHVGDCDDGRLQIDMILSANRILPNEGDGQADQVDDEYLPELLSLPWESVFMHAAIQIINKTGHMDAVSYVSSSHEEGDYQEWVMDAYCAIDKLADYIDRPKPKLADRNDLKNFPEPTADIMMDTASYYGWAANLHDMSQRADGERQNESAQQLRTAYGWIKESLSRTATGGIDAQLKINQFKDEFLYIAANGLDSAMQNEDNDKQTWDHNDSDDPYDAAYIADYVRTERRNLLTVEEYLIDQKRVLSHEKDINAFLQDSCKDGQVLSERDFKNYCKHMTKKDMHPEIIQHVIQKANGYQSLN